MDIEQGRHKQPVEDKIQENGFNVGQEPQIDIANFQQDWTKIVKAVALAQQKGAYSLQDASIVFNSVSKLNQLFNSDKKGD